MMRYCAAYGDMNDNFDLNEIVKRIRIPRMDLVPINFMKELKYIKSKDN
jgi:hypothetical protein